MTSTLPWLLLLVPLIGAVGLIFAPAQQAKWIALTASTATFIISVIIALGFPHWSDGGWGLQATAELLPKFGISLTIGADTVSLQLLLLTSLL